MINKILKRKEEEKKQKEAARVEARPGCDEQASPVAINYSLTVDELADGISMLIDKRSPRSRKIMGAVMFIIAVVCVVLYALQPYGVHYAFGAVVFGVMTFLVLGYPTIKGRMSAKQISRKQGIYKLVFTPDGYIKPYGEDKIDLWADSGSRAYESDMVFAIRGDRMHSFCISKKALSADQTDRIRALLKKYTGEYIDRCRKN